MTSSVRRGPAKCCSLGDSRRSRRACSAVAAERHRESNGIGHAFAVTYGPQRGESSMRFGSLVIAVLLAAPPALAQHSNSAFDGDKVVVLKGTVTQWKWSNPHVWIFLSVDDEKGGKAEWAIEGRTPGQLVRSGWSKSSLKPGDVITVDFSPA